MGVWGKQMGFRAGELEQRQLSELIDAFAPAFPRPADMIRFAVQILWALIFGHAANVDSLLGAMQGLQRLRRKQADSEHFPSEGNAGASALATKSGVRRSGVLIERESTALLHRPEAVGAKATWLFSFQPHRPLVFAGAQS